MKEAIRNFLLFIFGGLSYILIELCWRHHTHWTMFFLGGLCFLLVGLINNKISWDMPIEKQMLLGGAAITILEFITGIIVNVILQWNVWDYSDTPFSICGQICLPFSLAWMGISLAIILVDDYIRWKAFKEEKPHYYSYFLEKKFG